MQPTNVRFDSAVAHEDDVQRPNEQACPAPAQLSITGPPGRPEASQVRTLAPSHTGVPGPQPPAPPPEPPPPLPPPPLPLLPPLPLPPLPASPPSAPLPPLPLRPAGAPQPTPITAMPPSTKAS